MDENISHSADMGLFVVYPLTMASWDLNPGFGERDHCTMERPRLPKGIDNRPYRVFGLWIEIVFAVRAFDPAYGQCRNDAPCLARTLRARLMISVRFLFSK